MTAPLQNLRLDDWLVLADVEGARFCLITEMWPEWEAPAPQEAVLERARHTELRYWLPA